MSNLKKYTKWLLVIVTSFWSASITIFWGFIALIVLMTYKTELASLSNLLFDLRLILIQNWKIFWMGFFGLELINKLTHSSD